MRRALACLAAAAMLILGCGARTGLEDADASTGDARPIVRDAIADAPFDLPDAPAMLACDGLPLPRATAIAAIDTVPRGRGSGVIVPEPAGLLVIGGMTSATTYAAQMAFVDFGSATTQELTVLGDAVSLPLSDDATVFVAAGDTGTAIVIGGSIGGGTATHRAFAITGEGDPGGLRRVRAHVLPDFPGPPLGLPSGHVAIYDPRARRVIVHGGQIGKDDFAPTVPTWALDLEPEPRWRELLPADRSPSRETRAMGYDPVRHRAIEITTDETGTGAAVYALTLEPGSERWERLGPIDFVPSLRGELVWDARVCGFHLLSARRTRCVLEHWILIVSGSSFDVVFRGELDLVPSQFNGSSIFVPSRSELLVYGSERCEELGVPSTVMHAITLGR